MKAENIFKKKPLSPRPTVQWVFDKVKLWEKIISWYLLFMFSFTWEIIDISLDQMNELQRKHLHSLNKIENIEGELHNLHLKKKHIN